MDRIDAMRLFVRVVERRSFTAAAADLGLPRSTATEAVRRLEERLGSRLLERTTRHVAPTCEGRDYHRRCLAILAAVEEADDAARQTEPRGRLHVDAHGTLTRALLLPHLPAFLARYPGLELRFGQGDRLVDMLREGVDCVIRAGTPTEEGMIRRSLGSLPEVTCASPGYLARHGVPDHPDALEGHRMVGYVSSRSNAVMPLDFTMPGGPPNDGPRTVLLPSPVTVNEAETAVALARLGFGLLQAPRYRLADDLAQGTLVEVLAAHPPPPLPLNALYPQSRRTVRRLRVFLDWVQACLAASGAASPRQRPGPLA